MSLAAGRWVMPFRAAPRLFFGGPMSKSKPKPKPTPKPKGGKKGKGY